MEQDKSSLPFATLYGSMFPLVLVFDFFAFLNGTEFLRIIYGLYTNFSYWNFLVIPLTIFLIGLGTLVAIRVILGYMF